jgi:microsomal dipeptidase-like Zn-dependent dipeptidase
MMKVTLIALCFLLLLVDAAAPDVTSLDGLCFALRVNGRYVVRGLLESYVAIGSSASQPFRFQKTGTDSYLLYGTDEDFLGTGLDILGLRSAKAAGSDTNWRLLANGNGVIVSSVSTSHKITVEPLLKSLVTTSPQSRGTVFELIEATGCADAPEADINIEGVPVSGTVDGEVQGLAELHGHLTAYEFIGGDIHCGQPWSQYGITDALVDCPDHEPHGLGAIWENLVGGGYPNFTHSTTGWPTFYDWPKYSSITHEAMYYKWLERAWRGGLRVFTNHFVNNDILCQIYPFKHNSCNDMESIRLQAQRIYELQEFIDQEHGGPGKGWFRIVLDPDEARSVIEQGKLAVTLGVEVSTPFGCGIRNGIPECSKSDIDKGLDELYDLGVRRMFVCHKFDNALCGVRFDKGIAGVVINLANFLSTGEFWQVEDCPTDAADNPIDPAAPGPLLDLLFSLLPDLLPPGVTLPLYPEAPHCNVKGLSDLGEYTVRKMMERGMLVEVDHMSVKAADQTLDLLEAASYPGVVSGHSWADPTFYRRIFKLGGMAVPYGFGTEAFYNNWKTMKADAADTGYEFGFGVGFDTGGFGQQPPPRSGSAVTYPFKSYDGGSTVDKQTSGTRVFDINVDGLAHYGLMPDWLEDLRIVAGSDGEAIISDMGRGAEAYLQAWARATKAGTT